MAIKYTPMIEQYLEIKKDYADCIVFFRLGDFYEMFFDDAILASKELEIALTARDGGSDEKIPMCGVPHHAATPYIEKLINKGYKVAIAEQVTEPGKGLVERAVTKLITPGMIIDDGILDKKDNNYIGAIGQDRLFFSLSYSDVSTGDLFLIENLRRDNLLKEIEKVDLKELVLTKELNYLKKYLNPNLLISFHQELKESSYNENLQPSSKEALSLLLGYLSKIETNIIEGLSELRIINNKKYLQLDQNSIAALELTDSNFKGNHSLFKVLDKNQTAMGSRLLKQFILKPLLDVDKINQRLHFIETFKNDNQKRNTLIESLKGVYDLKRISTRMANLNVSPKDLSQLKNTLFNIPSIIDALQSFNDKRIKDYTSNIKRHQELYDVLDKAIIDNPPLLIKEGGIFKAGYNKTLDEFKNVSASGKDWIKAFEEKEREKTGIRNLRVGYNRVFGYYIEISKANALLVKEEYGYIRKQTLVNSERFINDELKEKEEIILNAADKIIQLEYDLFVELRTYVKTFAKSLQDLADKIAFIDVMQSLALVALKNNYIKPEIKTDDREMFIEKGRHPMVEVFQEEPFIANDVSMIDGGILLITGPNMSGKSTYMRMVAIIVLMAQMGSFVPATIAKLPLFDAIYTRIGAQDDLTRGRSTFMVEMLETNEALKNATSNSLLIFDEIGRGTATYDGMALAQGIIEYIHQSIKASLLFSTHYHELTHLEKVLKRLKNIHVSAVLEKGSLVFLHQVKEGPTDKSYGINVAALAKLPKPLINRSQIILDHFEEDKQKDLELTIFNYEALEETEVELSKEHEALKKRIQSIDIEHLTPIEALLLLKELQEDV